MPRNEYRKFILEQFGSRRLDFRFESSCRFPVLGAFFTFWVGKCPNTGRNLLQGRLTGSARKRFEGADRISVKTSEGETFFLPNGKLKPLTIANPEIITSLGNREPPKRFSTVGERSRQSIRPRDRGNRKAQNYDKRKKHGG